MNLQTRNSKDCPIKDLLFLIKQNEIEGLRVAMLDVIEQSYPNSEIYIYEQSYDFYEADRHHYSPILLESRGKNNNKEHVITPPSKEEKLTIDNFKFLPTDDYIQVFSVEAEHSNRGLLITINDSVVDDGYINILLEVYNQQIYLLRNKDSDSLTGLYNRQSFDHKLKRLHKHLSYGKCARDNQLNYYFALLDIDWFKRINDEYGHIYGDEVLLLFSNLMKKTFRDDDLLFRYGGEEFAILLKNVSSDQANIILNRFRINVEKIPFPLNHTVTVSIGYTAFTEENTLSTIINRADKALYFSKEHGRNSVNNFEYLLSENKISDIAVNESEIEIF